MIKKGKDIFHRTWLFRFDILSLSGLSRSCILPKLFRSGEKTGRWTTGCKKEGWIVKEGGYNWGGLWNLIFGMSACSMLYFLGFPTMDTTKPSCGCKLTYIILKGMLSVIVISSFCLPCMCIPTTIIIVNTNTWLLEVDPVLRRSREVFRRAAGTRPSPWYFGIMICSVFCCWTFGIMIGGCSCLSSDQHTQEESQYLSKEHKGFGHFVGSFDHRVVCPLHLDDRTLSACQLPEERFFTGIFRMQNGQQIWLFSLGLG